MSFNLEFEIKVAIELAGIETIEGTYPFTLETSLARYRLNDFLRRLIIPEHRERFVNDLDLLMSEYGLSDFEQIMVRDQQWLAMIKYGVIFFVLEKMAAV